MVGIILSKFWILETRYSPITVGNGGFKPVVHRSIQIGASDALADARRQVTFVRTAIFFILACIIALPVTSASPSVLAKERFTNLHHKDCFSAPHLSRTINVFVAGDVMLGRGAALNLQQHRTSLQLLSPQIRNADIAFCNLECVLFHAPNNAEWKPKLLASPLAVNYLSKAGIDVVSIANNHTFDAGEIGVETTLRTLRKAGIAGIGTAQCSPKAKSAGLWPVWESTIRHQRIAWLAASAYGPWEEGGMRMRNIAGTGLTQQVRSLTRYGDIVFVSLHWGNEYSRTVTIGQVQFAHRLIDAGAVAVVGHHPHVAQPIEVYRGKPIFYSLGNFVFDTLRGRTQDGFAAMISVLTSGAVQFRTLPIKPVEQNLSPAEQAQFVQAREQAPDRAAALHLFWKRPPQLPLPRGEQLVKYLPGRFLRGNSSLQVIVWSRNATGQSILRSFVRRARGWHCLAEGHHPDIFDLQVGDIDRDGKDEVILGLVQRSKLDIHIAPRLYVYSVSESGVFEPRWRGSGLSRPFGQFWLLPTGSGCDLIALEKDSLPEYRQFVWLSVYRWDGFGLRRLWNTPVRGSVRQVSTGCDHHGSFVKFTQVLTGVRRQLILRRTDGAGESRKGETEFVARLLVHSPHLLPSPKLPSIVKSPFNGENERDQYE